MLRIVSYDAMSDKDSLMASLINTSSQAGEKCIVIVPDQFSFEYDKMLYNAMGAKSFNNITTGGFNRICELICKKHGGYAGENANENLSVIMMFLAIKSFKAEGGIQYYKKSLDKGSFIGRMISLVRELRQSGITPEALMAASAENDGMLSKKLYDISKLYSFYMQELEERELKDDCDGISTALRLSEEHNSFEGAEIFIDAFHSFTYNELKFIRSMIAHANSVTVGLMIGSSKNAFTPLSPFTEPVKTRTALENIARELNVKTEYLNAPPREKTSESISFINSHIFTPVKKDDRCKSSEGVKIISACDIYEEAEYVCSEIKRLVLDKGFKYSDCAVLIRDPAANRSALSSIFERYEIPCFIDMREPISQYSFVMYFEGLFRCLLTKQYKTEYILRCIKSPLSNFLEYEASLLEDYCIAWNVEGDMWKSEFTAKDKDIPDDSDYLKCVNEYRKKIIEPFERFKENSKDQDAKGISRALYTLLDDVRLSDRSYSMVRISMSEDDEQMLETSRKFRQLWELAVSCISAVFKNIPDEKLSLRQYYELIRTMFSNICVSSPPQKLDSVIIGDSSHSRVGVKKAVFVMNCNDGVFPSDIKSDGLISDNEKHRLEESGIVMPNGMNSKTAHERLVCYSALTCASDRLYILWHESDSKGKLQRRSSLLMNISNFFTDSIEIKASSMPIDFYCPTYKSAYTKYLEHCHDKSSDISSLKAALETNKHYRNRIDYIVNNGTKRDLKLSRKAAGDLFFAGDINISASRVDTYYRCPFSYFCQYGLKIYPPVKDKTDPRNRGTFVHSCLEKILSVKGKDGSPVYNDKFRLLSDEELEAKIHEFFLEYLENDLGGTFGKTSRFNFISHRWEESAFHVIKNLRDELSASLFKPVGFEFDLTREDDQSLLQIYSEGKYKIDIRGSIDRVDIFEKKDEDGSIKKYVRIIDYKTGRKELKLEELYNGLNLQMLIYLLALTNSDNPLTKEGKLIPSGVLYMPTVYVNADSDSNKAYERGLEGDLEEELENYRYDKFRRFGLIVDNSITTDALGSIAKRFVDIGPEGRKKSNSIMLPEGEIEAYEEFALDKIVEMADKLYDGRIEASPLYTDKKNVKCSFCDYNAVCRNAFPKEHRQVERDDSIKMQMKIEKIMNGGADNAVD